MDITNKNLDYLFRGFKKTFEGAFSGHQDTSEYKRFTMEVKSSTASTTFPWLGLFPKLREWIGERHVKKLDAHEYTIRNRKFESTVGVPREVIEDNTFSILNVLFEEMGIATAEHPGDLVYELIKMGETAKGYDDVPFFSATHPMGTGTFTNFQGGAGQPWLLLATKRSIKPFILQNRIAPEFQRITKKDDENVIMHDEYIMGVRKRCNVGFGLPQLAFLSKQVLDANNFNDAIVQMMSLKNEEGSDLKVRPNLLITTPANRAAALTLLKAERDASGATNTNYNVVDLLITNQLS